MHRTDTTLWRRFDLAKPEPVTFDIDSPVALKITVPEGSQWFLRWHWSSPAPHITIRGIRVIRNRWRINYVGHISTGNYRGETIYINPPHSMDWFEAGSAIAVGPLRDTPADKDNPVPSEGYQIELTADTLIFHQLASAATDRDKVPHLTSTPLWLRGVFALLNTSRRERLLDAVLWVQLMSMYWTFGYRFHFTAVPFEAPWTWQPFGGKAPDWCWRWHRRTEVAATALVMGLGCHWLGWLLLGVHGRYAEYTPASAPAAGKGADDMQQAI